MPYFYCGVSKRRLKSDSKERVFIVLITIMIVTIIIIILTKLMILIHIIFLKNWIYQFLLSNVS